MLKRPSTLTHPDAPLTVQGRGWGGGEICSVPYAEPLSDAGTMLADLFSVLLDPVAMVVPPPQDVPHTYPSKNESASHTDTPHAC
jgi:hypothetical protein